MKLSKAKLRPIIKGLASGILLGLVLLGGLGLVGIASAQGEANIPGITPVGPETVGGLVDILRAIVRWVYIIFFVIAVLLIIFAAFTYLTAAGNEEKVKKAKDMIIYAAVAIVVALLAVSFEIIIRNFLTAPGA
jgi:heme/copper-type cytochrome/quinol oxidase subunit 2